MKHSQPDPPPPESNPMLSGEPLENSPENSLMETTSETRNSSSKPNVGPGTSSNLLLDLSDLLSQEVSNLESDSSENPTPNAKLLALARSLFPVSVDQAPSAEWHSLEDLLEILRPGPRRGWGLELSRLARVGNWIQTRKWMDTRKEVLPQNREPFLFDWLEQRGLGSQSEPKKATLSVAMAITMAERLPTSDWWLLPTMHPKDREAPWRLYLVNVPEGTKSPVEGSHWKVLTPWDNETESVLIPKWPCARIPDLQWAKIRVAAILDGLVLGAKPA